MVFNATFNNISAISWRSVLLVEDTGVPGENHRPVASHWQTLSHNVVHLALIEIRTQNISGDILYIYCTLVREIWKFIHLRVSYSLRAFRVPLTFSCQRTITLAGKPARHPRGWKIIFISRIWFLSCVITCSNFYPFFNQINLFMVINIWGLINFFVSLNKSDFLIRIF
jgi:hypothetical protein